MATTIIPRTDLCTWEGALALAALAREGGPRVVLALLTLIAVAPTAIAGVRIPATQLTDVHWSGGLVDNLAFMPPAESRRARDPFTGTVQLREIEMATVPQTFKSRQVLGKDAKVFPAVAISFITVNDDLVPTTQDVIRYGSLARGRSLWDVIVQPGRVWCEPGDGQWFRAAFPFALVHSLSGETHNGVAIFLYQKGRVSNLRFQIVQQTAPYFVAHYFTAAGLVPATLDSTPIESGAAIAEIYKKSLTDRVLIGSWEDLARKVGANRLADFDGAVTSANVLLAGLDYEGIFYLKYCRSAAGPLPWCDRARFGVWSATKALANELALLRLAQKYGPEVFDLKVVDYVPSVARNAGWRDVRFNDTANMSTGVGNGSTKTDPNDIFDGVGVSYATWYEARSAHEKIDAILHSAHTYPWGPGKIVQNFP